MLQTILAWLTAAFSNVLTALSGAVNGILNELPAQVQAGLHAGAVAAAQWLQTNSGDIDGAITAGLNAAEVSLGRSLAADEAAFLTWFANATAAKASS